ncbi:MAG: alkaline phosphatase family protein [Bythopirellula sp.]
MKKISSLCAILAVLLSAHGVLAQPMSIVIGVDGLGFGPQGFSAANKPVMDSLINGTWQAGYNGAYSDRAFAGGILGTPTQQATSSGPGWSTIHTGVWVDQHNVPNNSFSSPDFTNNPSYLETLEENVANVHSASIVNWNPINDFIVSTVNDGNSSMDLISNPTGGDVGVRNAVITHINSLGGGNPAAIFVHFDELDGVGHGVGSANPNYAAKITEIDTQIGDLLDSIVARPTFSNEDWQVIVTSDHGHQDDFDGDHGGQSVVERTVPFIVASESLNQGNLPVSFPQEVSHADVAPTVLDHFGLAIPSHYYGVSRAAGLPVADPDINGDGQVQGDGTGTFADDDVVAFISLWLQPNTVQNPNPADFNFDGITDLSDWIFLNGFDPAMGAAALAGIAGSAVPEPGCLALTVALFGMLSMQRVRPCQQSS